MKDFKLSNRELCLCILLIFFGFIGIFSLYQLKNNKGIEQHIDYYNTLTANRYVNIVKESEQDILDFLYTNISEEFIVVPALDYVFEECFERFSDEGKSTLYYYYYDNYNRFRTLYQDLIDVIEYRYHLLNLINSYENPDEVDINSPEFYSNINLTSLRTLITELRSNHFKLHKNGEYFEIYFDYDWFYQEYKDILPDIFKDFIKLEALSMSPSLAPERSGIDVYSVEDLLIQSKEFLDKYGNSNEGLRVGALQLYRNALQYLFAGSDDSIFLYSDIEKYIISEEAYEYYDEFIETYPDSSVSVLLKQLIEIMKEKEGNSKFLTEYISPVIDEYLVEYGYYTEEEMQKLQDTESKYIGEQEYLFEAENKDSISTNNIE